MNSYLRDGLCSGFPPHGVDGSGMFARNALVSKMMLGRSRVRVLCAPALFGKTSLLYQYAQLVFDFHGVLWLDARHPRFLKDLASGAMSSSVGELDPEPSLVVFEDVPRFDDALRAAFRSLCRELLERGCEVALSCACAGNPFEGEDGIILIGAEDLMYSDAELEELRLVGGVSSKRVQPPALERVPGLLNKPAGAVERFLRDAADRESDGRRRALGFAIALLERASLDDLSSVLGFEVSLDDLRISQERPYIRLSDFRSGFSVEGFTLDETLKAVAPRLGEACACLPDADPDSFVCRIADVLAASGRFGRACRIAAGACGLPRRVDWAREHIDAAILSCTLNEALLLLASLGRDRLARDPYLLCCEACIRCWLDEPRTGAEVFLGEARRAENEPELRLVAAACTALLSTRHPSQVDFGDTFDAACLEAARRSAPGPLAAVWNAILEGDGGAGVLCARELEKDSPLQALLACALCLHAAGIASSGEGPDSQDMRRLESLTAKSVRLVQLHSARNDLRLACFMLYGQVGSASSSVEWDRACAKRMEGVRKALSVQRMMRRRALEGRHSAACGAAPAPQGESAPASGKTPARLPALEVTLFGRFEVKIGGVAVDPKSFSRQKVRCLLAMLVLNAGKDLSCDRLAGLLWPESTDVKARRNFYSIFSMLRHGLELPDGSCPYLLRTQGVCRLVSDSLKCDAEELRGLCRKLRFEDADSRETCRLLGRLRQLYPGELLPGEQKVAHIASTRNQWRNRVVDALLAASRRLKEEGDLSLALDCAHQALSYDSQREDCYEQLMVLQAASSQRAGAIETFLDYRRVNRSLGITESSRMLRLYDIIINDGVSAGSAPGWTEAV